MYEVKMVIRDNGNHAIFPPVSTTRTESTHTNFEDRDEYYDVFPTYERALQFYNANKEEI